VVVGYCQIGSGFLMCDNKVCALVQLMVTNAIFYGRVSFVTVSDEGIRSLDGVGAGDS